MDVKKPTNEPTPDSTAFLIELRVTINSAMTAPKNGPKMMPAKGITNGPINKPIVLPHIPALEPPNFFTPTIFDSVSALNNKTVKSISISQNHQARSPNS